MGRACPRVRALPRTLLRSACAACALLLLASGVHGQREGGGGAWLARAPAACAKGGGVAPCRAACVPCAHSRRASAHCGAAASSLLAAPLAAPPLVVYCPATRARGVSAECAEGGRAFVHSHPTSLEDFPHLSGPCASSCLRRGWVAWLVKVTPCCVGRRELNKGEEGGGKDALCCCALADWRH